MSSFIRKGNKFIKIEKLIGNGSINDIISYLGYNYDQVHSFLHEDKGVTPVAIVVLEVFTDNVIVALTNDDIDFLSTNSVEKFMEAFDFNIEYGSYSIQDILLEGINNKSFGLDFLSRVLEFEAKNQNEEYFSEKIDCYLFFLNGRLASFKFADELNKWARYLKEINPDIISGYAREAKEYWKNDYENIFAEINLQADAFAAIPDAFQNKYVKRHMTKFGNIDFFMLIVCHYGQKINLADFKEINYGRCLDHGIFNGFQRYSKGNYYYDFEENGVLVKIKKKR